MMMPDECEIETEGGNIESTSIVHVLLFPDVRFDISSSYYAQFESLFPHVISVSRTVRMGGRASEILDAIFLHTHSGFPLVRECFHR